MIGMFYAIPPLNYRITVSTKLPFEKFIYINTLISILSVPPGD